jgi:hypothetical protein
MFSATVSRCPEVPVTRQFHLWSLDLPGIHFSLRLMVGSVLDSVRMWVVMQLMQPNFFAKLVEAVRDHSTLRWSVAQYRCRGGP